MNKILKDDMIITGKDRTLSIGEEHYDISKLLTAEWNTCKSNVAGS